MSYTDHRDNKWKTKILNTVRKRKLKLSLFILWSLVVQAKTELLYKRRKSEQEGKCSMCFRITIWHLVLPWSSVLQLSSKITYGAISLSSCITWLGGDAQQSLWKFVRILHDIFRVLPQYNKFEYDELSLMMN